MANLLGAIVTSIAVAPGAAVPPESAAERGRIAYAEGRWEDAIEALRQAYADNPHPGYLFARAQALRAAGRCDEALPVYEEFLGQDPGAAELDNVQAAINVCEQAVSEDTVEGLALDATPLRSPPAAEAVEPTLASTASDDFTRATDPSPPRVWFRDPLGHSLSWPGLAIAVGGGVALAWAHRRADAAENAEDEDAYRDRLGPAPAVSRAGIGLMVGGSAALLAGVVRFVVVARRRRAR